MPRHYLPDYRPGTWVPTDEELREIRRVGRIVREQVVRAEETARIEELRRAIDAAPAGGTVVFDEAAETFNLFEPRDAFYRRVRAMERLAIFERYQRRVESARPFDAWNEESER